MRKIITALVLLASSVALLSSCEGAPGRDGLGVMDTILINVTQASWNKTQNNDNNYFYATVDVPEITEEIFDKGVVKMYRTFNYDHSNASQMEMPYSWQHEYFISGNDWGFYTEQVSYEYCIGGLSIYYTVSDFDYELNEKFCPEAMQFRLVIMY